MKKHFKKRLAAFKVGLVLSIMITPFCFYKLSDTVQAAGNVITYNNYGSTERGVVNVAFNGTTYMTDSFIRFNFNGNYNGVLGINLSGASPMSSLAVVPDNCHIISTATNYIQIEFYGVNQCEVHFTGWQAVVGNFDIQSVIWNSMTKISDSNAAQLVNIKNRLDTLNGYTDQIESLLTTNNTLLQTIANNGGSGGSSTVNNIDINVDHIADELSLLKTSNDSILDELLGFFSDGLGHILTIDNVVTAIEDTTTALLGIQNQLTGISTTLNSISTTLNNINTAVQNIDNSIDTISWHMISENVTMNNLGNGKYRSSQIPLPATQQKRVIYKFKINIVSNDDKLFYNFKWLTGSNAQNTLTDNIYYTWSRYELNLYVYDNLGAPSTINNFIQFETDKNNLTVDSLTLYSISEDDIEYWNLLSYFDQYDMQRKLLSALEQLSINVHGDIVQQTEQVINNYDTDFTTIHNIENNFTNNFDSVNPSVNSLLNQNLQLPNGFLEGSSFVKVLFPKIVDNSSLVGFPYFLILAIVVLIVLLG